MLPDTLDQWLAAPLFKPDIHIVPDPAAPDPTMIAQALALTIAKAHSSPKPLNIECYPLPIGPARWRPYTLLFDCTHQNITVTLSGHQVVSATESTPYGFRTDATNRLTVSSRPLSLRITPLSSKRLAINIAPTQQQWSHSLMLAFAAGLLATGIGGMTAGLIAGGAYALHIFTDQWGYFGCNLFWPLTANRHQGLQWLKPQQHQTITIAILWLALLLIAGNIHHHSKPGPDGLSRHQLLLFGGVLPLAGWALYHRTFRR
jgi:membrane-bound metal-dependent hydrolase YbcI (DUF457 family)